MFRLFLSLPLLSQLIAQFALISEFCCVQFEDEAGIFYLLFTMYCAGETVQFCRKLWLCVKMRDFFPQKSSKIKIKFLRRSNTTKKSQKVTKSGKKRTKCANQKKVLYYFSILNLFQNSSCHLNIGEV